MGEGGAYKQVLGQLPGAQQKQPGIERCLKGRQIDTNAGRHIITCFHGWRLA